MPSNEVDAPIVPIPGGANGASAGFNSVSCTSVTQCVGVGANGALQAVADSTSSSGATWKHGSVQQGVPVLDAVACATAQRCVAVGRGVAVSSSDGGVTWTTESIPTPNTTLLDVSCPSASACVSVGVSPGASGPFQGQVLISSDGGVTWAASSLPPGAGALGSVSCPTTTLCVAVGASILVSTDAGATWSERAVAGGTGVLRSVACSSASTCVALGPNPAVAQDTAAPAYAILTTDGGQTWAPVTMAPGTGDLFALACSPQGHCEAAGSSPVGATAVQVMSSDGGATWRVDPSAAALDAVSAVACVSATCLFAGRQGGAPVTSTESAGTSVANGTVSALIRVGRSS